MQHMLTTMANRRTTPFRLRLCVIATLEADFTDEEPPSLGGIPVYDTTAEESPEAPALAKCGAAVGERKRASR